MKQLVLVSVTIVLLLFVGIAGNANLCAQNQKPSESQRKVILKKADSAYGNLNYASASTYYEEYLQAASNENKDVLTKLADSYWRNGKYDAALRVYKQLFPSATTETTKQLQLRIAELYARFSDYEHASQWLRGVEGYKAKTDAYNSVSVIESMKKDSLSWTVGLLDLNTIYHEFSPYLADNFIYFSSNRYNGSKKKTKEDGGIGLNYARLWKVPVKDVHTCTSTDKTNVESNLVDGFKAIQYNTAPVSIDNNNHFYFSTNSPIPDNTGVKRLCLMEAFYTPNGHLKTKVIPLGDSKIYTVMHPAINADGTLLVVSSNKPEGVGGYDLYYTQRKNIDQSWSELKPLSHNVNTMGNEVFPTITSNGYLYYSSDAMPGLGGLDLFRILLKDGLSGAGTPEHLSYPINSSSDDFGWAQGETDTTGYFTSDRLGNNDIYIYSYKEPISLKINNVKVKQIDSTNVCSNKMPDFNTKDLFSILFSSNKCDITPSNYYLTNALLRVMKKYPCLKLLIKSYTDTDGGDVFNRNLSKCRAIYTRNYLIKKGINSSRLDTVCLGKTQQLNENKNAVEKAINRRVLFQAASTGCNLSVDSLLSAELLVKHEITYSKKTYVLREGGRFVVQVGAFKSNTNAFALVSRLKKILPENIYVIEENDGLYHVRVGSSKSFVEAERMAALIEAIGILN